MLKEMKIENFALIENLHLEFKRGFSVISGETGSGKSILIDAMCFILGFKFNKNIVRNGECKTIVEAIFDINHEKINEIIEENGIALNDYLFIRREGHLNGKSIVRINGKVVTNNVLKLISKYLMDIHTQHQNYELLNNSKHINYLDKYIGDNLDFSNYLKIFREWNEVKDKIVQIKNKDLNQSYIEYVKFQIDELDKACLIEGEDVELEAKLKLLNNGEKISKSLNSVLDCLNYNEHNNICSNLMNVIKSLRSVGHILDDIDSIANKFEEIYYEIESLCNDVKEIESNVHFDLNEFDEINSRIYLLNSLKRKFDKNFVKELLDYKCELNNFLDEVLNQESILKSFQDKENELYEKLVVEGNKISEIRKQYARRIEDEIILELNYMGMENISFKIFVEKDSEFSQFGNDNVNFFISTNKGEPLKNLSQIVSGGELSRIMLALKIVFIGKEPIAGIIFDEIDTGVSGKVARKVGEKMYYLSSRCQVFCITHLPQIASLSDKKN